MSSRLYQLSLPPLCPFMRSGPKLTYHTMNKHIGSAGLCQPAFLPTHQVNQVSSHILSAFMDSAHLWTLSIHTAMQQWASGTTNFAQGTVLGSFPQLSQPRTSWGGWGGVFKAHSQCRNPLFSSLHRSFFVLGFVVIAASGFNLGFGRTVEALFQKRRRKYWRSESNCLGWSIPPPIKGLKKCSLEMS